MTNIIPNVILVIGNLLAGELLKKLGSGITKYIPIINAVLTVLYRAFNGMDPVPIETAIATGLYSGVKNTLQAVTGSNGNTGKPNN